MRDTFEGRGLGEAELLVAIAYENHPCLRRRDVASYAAPLVAEHKLDVSWPGYPRASPLVISSAAPRMSASSRDRLNL
jgi:hypothetical protein